MRLCFDLHSLYIGMKPVYKCPTMRRALATVFRLVEQRTKVNALRNSYAY